MPISALQKFRHRKLARKEMPLLNHKGGSKYHIFIQFCNRWGCCYKICSHRILEARILKIIAYFHQLSNLLYNLTTRFQFHIAIKVFTTFETAFLSPTPIINSPMFHIKFAACWEDQEKMKSYTAHVKFTILQWNGQSFNQVTALIKQTFAINSTITIKSENTTSRILRFPTLMISCFFKCLVSLQ